MDTSSIRFVLTATIVGMGTVFLFLSFLSVLMVIIQKLCSPRQSAPQKKRRTADPTSVSSHGNEAKLPDNIIVAAAAAYLFLEADDSEKDANLWKTTRPHHISWRNDAKIQYDEHSLAQ